MHVRAHAKKRLCTLGAMGGSKVWVTVQLAERRPLTVTPWRVYLSAFIANGESSLEVHLSK